MSVSARKWSESEAVPCGHSEAALRRQSARSLRLNGPVSGSGVWVSGWVFGSGVWLSSWVFGSCPSVGLNVRLYDRCGRRRVAQLFWSPVGYP